MTTAAANQVQVQTLGWYPKTFYTPAGVAPPDPPVPPRLLALFLFPTKARFCGMRFSDEGTHVNTKYELRRVDDDSLVAAGETGAGVTNFTVLVQLVEGDAYAGRIQYANEAGYSGRSPRVRARVPTTVLAAPGEAVPIEPEATVPVPIQPAFGQQIERVRDIWTMDTETAHVRRRPRQSLERRAATIVWQPLTVAERDTMDAFLEARVSATPPEGFTTTDPILGSRSWWPRRGRREVALVDAETWRVRCDCDEGLAQRFWTVERSKVGGPDRIRG